MALSKKGNTYKVLYFTNSFAATAKELADAESYDGTVYLRNGRFADKTTVENCDAVAGNVPDAYRNKPKAKKVKTESQVVPSSDATLKGS